MAHSRVSDNTLFLNLPLLKWVSLFSRSRNSEDCATSFEPFLLFPFFPFTTITAILWTNCECSPYCSLYLKLVEFASRGHLLATNQHPCSRQSRVWSKAIGWNSLCQATWRIQVQTAFVNESRWIWSGRYRIFFFCFPILSVAFVVNSWTNQKLVIRSEKTFNDVRKVHLFSWWERLTAWRNWIIAGKKVALCHLSSFSMK